MSISFNNKIDSDVACPILETGKAKKAKKAYGRLIFSKLKNQSQFFIRAMAVPLKEKSPSCFRRLFWVKVEIKGQPIYVNINSLCKRFLLTKHEVRAHSKDLLEFITSRSKTLKEIHKNKLLKNPDLLSQNTLLKIILRSNGFFHEKTNFKTKDFESSDLKKGFYLANNYFIKKERNLFVLDLVNAIDIDSGSTSKALRVKNLADNRFVCMKQPCNAESTKKFLNEAKNLKRLVKFKKVKLLEPAPLLFVEDNERPFLITKLFADQNKQSFDLHRLRTQLDWNNRAHRKVILNYCKQVWQAWKTIEKLKIHHSDIKPANFLSETNKKGETVLVLADLATARFKLEDVDGYEACTPEFAFLTLFRRKDTKYSLETREMAALTSDLLATVVTLFYLITGQYPYDRKLPEVEDLQRSLLKKPLKSDEMKKLGQGPLCAFFRELLPAAPDTFEPYDKNNWEGLKKRLDLLWKRLESDPIW